MASRAVWSMGERDCAASSSFFRPLICCMGLWSTSVAELSADTLSSAGGTVALSTAADAMMETNACSTADLTWDAGCHDDQHNQRSPYSLPIVMQRHHIINACALPE